MKPYNEEGKTKGEEVREMFDTIAPAYDRLNHILSLQIDKIWRRRVVRLVKKNSPANCSILDLATGTGDLAIAMAKDIPHSKILGVDPSEGMLNVAREKVNSQTLGDRLSFKVESAEELSLADNSFDAVTAAFGVRNFTDLKQGLSEMVRVARPNGWVVILEFSTPPNPLFRAIYTLYSRHILPRIGALLSRDRKAYEYLPASVEEFASPAEFIALMREVGLENCSSQSQSFGIAQIYIGAKK